MTLRCSTVSIALAALLGTISAAVAFDETKYPNLKGQWLRVGSANWRNSDQKPPLTPEYQLIFDANLRDQAAGGHGTEPSYACLSTRHAARHDRIHPRWKSSSPRNDLHPDRSHRRQLAASSLTAAAGRQGVEPTFHGYSIGQWIDTDNDGRYDTLEVETRIFKGPRAYDTTGMPLHSDNETVVKERIYLDKADPDLLHDDVTTIDHALTSHGRSRQQLPRDRAASRLGRDRTAPRTISTSASAPRTTSSAPTGC